MKKEKLYIYITIGIILFLVIAFNYCEEQKDIANLNNLEKIVVKLESKEGLYFYSFKENSYSELNGKEYNEIYLEPCDFEQFCKNPNNKDSYWHSNRLYYKNKKINDKHIPAYYYYWSKNGNYFITVNWLNYKPGHNTLWIVNTKTGRIHIVNTKNSDFNQVGEIVGYID